MGDRYLSVLAYTGDCQLHNNDDLIFTVRALKYCLNRQVTVTLAGLDGSGPVLCSRNMTLVPDKSLSDALAEKPQYDAVSITSEVY
jgi:hypothetical protein